MHSLEHLGPRKIIGFGDGSFFITETVLNMWILMAIMLVVAWFLTRKMEKIPKGPQLIAETIVGVLYKLVSGTMGASCVKQYGPYMGTLLLYLIFANALGLVGARPITADMNTCFALSFLSFLIIHGSSIRTRGFGGFVKHLSSPYIFMLPINIVTEIALPVSMGFRIFGNILGGAVVMALVMTGLGALTAMLGSSIPFLQMIIPLPLNLFFDVFEPFLQAFIFTMLTMVFTVNSMARPGEEH